MENTCLTFVTPVLIAHDRSLTDVCAHEIAYVYPRPAPHLTSLIPQCLRAIIR